MNRARRWYTFVTLLYDLCSGLAVFGSFYTIFWPEVLINLQVLPEVSRQSEGTGRSCPVVKVLPVSNEVDDEAEDKHADGDLLHVTLHLANIHAVNSLW